MTIAAPRTPQPLYLPFSEAAASCLRSLDRAYTVVPGDGAAVFTEGRGRDGAFVHPCLPGSLGDPAFLAAHGLRFAYVGGSMANGISSTELAEALGRAGMLGFYGAAGQPVEEVEKAIDRLRSADGIPYGFNLIHSPSDPALETALVDLYLKRGVRLVEASAFIGLTLPLIRFRTAGIRRAADGSIETPNRVIGKVSRVEVAERFFSPAPEKFLKELVSRGELTPEQAQLASLVPVAEDVTAEGDSGGHTDNRPLVNLLPTIIALRDRIQAERGYARAPRVGAGGGIATPEAA
ncbi:MAG TPA: 2-nitropropane dioxygenase, partial [Elusimicrobia bacterium]|nr:2-nitropropane dioxygenase [Elusimicrobiota bacterium]